MYFKYRYLFYEILFTFYVLFIPYAYHVDLGPGGDSVVAMIWELKFEIPEAYFRVLSPLWIYDKYSFLRILFLIVSGAFFFRKLRSRYFIISGFIADLFVLLFSIPSMYILNSEGENLFAILIPIPTLFILVLIIALAVLGLKSGFSLRLIKQKIRDGKEV